MLASSKRLIVQGLVSPLAMACHERTRHNTGEGAEPGDESELVVVEGEATFQVATSLSPVISAVGIVDWHVDVEPVQRFYVEFGLDTGYEYLAPVDLTAPNFRTGLLGMKPGRTYHVRILADENFEVDKRRLS